MRVAGTDVETYVTHALNGGLDYTQLVALVTDLDDTAHAVFTDRVMRSGRDDIAASFVRAKTASRRVERMRGESILAAWAFRQETDAPGFIPAAVWDARPLLSMIRQAAQARRVGPDAALGAVLARVAWLTDHRSLLPPLVGGNGTLDFISAIVGKSGRGKSAAMTLAEHLLPLPHGWKQHFSVGLSTGEGVIEKYMGMASEPNPDDPKKKIRVRKQTRTNGLFSLDEGAALQSLGDRKGSTVLATLRSAWVGAQLSTPNATEDRDRHLDALSYRFAMVIGFQTALAVHLIADAVAGTPQRLAWFRTGDPTARRGRGAKPPWPGALALDFGQRTFTLDPTIADFVDDVAVDVLLDVDERDDLDSHRELLRLKIAALLAVLDDRDDVNVEDWAIAGLILESSDTVRNDVLTAGREKRETERREMTELAIERAVAARGAVDDDAVLRAIRLAAGTVARHVWNQDVSCAGAHTRSCLHRALSDTQRKLLPDGVATAIDEAVEQEWITPELATGKVYPPRPGGR